MSTDRVCSTRGAGFTVVELLVVLAIIAILATLIASGVVRVRHAVDLAGCKNNLRQLGIALQLYLGDFAKYPQVNHGIKPWPDYLPTYLGADWPVDHELSPGKWIPRSTYSGNPYACPGYRRIRGVFTPTSDPPFYGAYGYNSGGVTMNSGLGWERKENSKGKPQEYHIPVSESLVANPSDMLAIADSVPLGHPRFLNLADSDLHLQLNCQLINDATAEGVQLSISSRHSGRWGSLFVDGHAESLKTIEIYNTRRVDVLRRWNRDNLPHEEAIWE